MYQPQDSLAVALFSEIFMADQLARNRLSRALPKGMELSHFSVLKLLVRSGAERTPAQLARAFHVTRGAMTNTIGKLEWAGYVHVRPDWDDARRKLISVSPSGRKARDAAFCIDESERAIRDDTRLDWCGRRRPDTPAGRAFGDAARHAQYAGLPPGGRGGNR